MGDAPPTRVSREASAQVGARGRIDPETGKHPGGPVPNTPGQPRVPGSGSKTPGTRIRGALNKMMTWSLDEVEAALLNPESPVAIRLAADRIITALKTGGSRADKAFEQIADRVEGRPHQSHEVRAVQVADPERLAREIEESLGLPAPPGEGDPGEGEGEGDPGG